MGEWWDGGGDSRQGDGDGDDDDQADGHDGQRGLRRVDEGREGREAVLQVPQTPDQRPGDGTQQERQGRAPRLRREAVQAPGSR
jgi:hypothetical protein